MSAHRVRELFGREAAAAHDVELESLLHLYALNSGVLMTPFHDMALIGPTTTGEQVDLHHLLEGPAGDLRRVEQADSGRENV
jgi:glutamate-1-semialdehyde aminotransferase